APRAADGAWHVPRQDLHSLHVSEACSQSPQHPNSPSPSWSPRPRPLGSAPLQISPGPQSAQAAVVPPHLPLSRGLPSAVLDALHTNPTPSKRAVGPNSLHGAVLTMRPPAYWLFAT